jgi:sulfur-oxidizing protein SoxB
VEAQRAATGPECAPREEPMAHVTLIQINDLHGYLAPHPELFDLPSGTEFRSGGGLARIARIFKDIRREVGDAVVALDNGDTFHGSMPAVLSRGEALVAPTSLLDLDAMTAHWEFAYGLERVRELSEQLPHPLIAANFTDDGGTLALPPFVVVERGGVKVAVIGLAAVVTVSVLPDADQRTARFSIGDSALKVLVPVLRHDHRAGVVVVLSHLGFPQDCRLARVVPGIDVILSGHTHDRMRAPALVNDTVIMQSGAHGSFVGRLDLDIAASGLAGWRHALLPVDDATQPDGEMIGAVERSLRDFAAAGTQVVGTTQTALTRYNMLESTMDNLLLDAVAESANVRVALSNGWRYGAPIPPGPITEADLWNIVPANPWVSAVTLTGNDLRELYEESLEATFACDPWEQRGGYVKRCRGLRIRFRVQNAAGHRLQELRVDDAPVRGGASYEVAFLGEQAVPARYAENRHSIGVRAVDALRQYVRRHSPVEAKLRGAVELA